MKWRPDKRGSDDLDKYGRFYSGGRICFTPCPARPDCCASARDPQSDAGPAAQPTSEAGGERLRLFWRVKRHRNQDTRPVLITVEARRLTSMMIEPQAHRAHLLTKITRAQLDFDSMHLRTPGEVSEWGGSLARGILTRPACAITSFVVYPYLSVGPRNRVSPCSPRRRFWLSSARPSTSTTIVTLPPLRYLWSRRAYNRPATRRMMTISRSRPKPPLG
jgi:hypothetical protein